MSNGLESGGGAIHRSGSRTSRRMLFRARDALTHLLGVAELLNLNPASTCVPRHPCVHQGRTPLPKCPQCIRRMPNRRHSKTIEALRVSYWQDQVSGVVSCFGAFVGTGLHTVQRGKRNIYEKRGRSPAKCARIASTIVTMFLNTSRTGWPSNASGSPSAISSSKVILLVPTWFPARWPRMSPS